MFKAKNAVAIFTIIAVLSLVFGSTVIFADTSEDEDVVVESLGGVETVSFGINIVENPGTVLVKTASGDVLYTITESGEYTFVMGAEVTLEAIPADRFDKWTGNIISGYSNDNPITAVLDKKNRQIDAHFRKATPEPEPEVITYTLTTGVVGEGTISPSTQQYEAGTLVPITTEAAPGWEFKGWMEGDGYSSPVDGSITMDSNKTVFAIFEEVVVPEPEVITYTLTTGVVGEGTISPETQDYPEGTEVPITATAASGWHFKGWMEGDGYSSPVDGSITMDGDKTVFAIFEKDAEPTPPSTPSTPSTPSAPPSTFSTPSSVPSEQDETIEILVEEVPEGSVDTDADVPSEDEEIIALADDVIPEADALPDSLPQTGGIPAGALYGFGSLLSAVGFFLRKKSR